MDYLTNHHPPPLPHQPDYDPALDTHFDSSSSSGDGSSTGDHSSPSAFSASSHQDWAIDLGLAMPWSPSAAATGFAAAVKVAPSSRATSREPPPPPAPAPGGHTGEGFTFTEDFWSASPGPSEATTAETGGRRRFEDERERERAGYFAATRGGNKVKKEDQDEDATPMDFEDMVHEGVCGPASAVPLPPASSPSAPSSTSQIPYPSMLIPSSSTNGLPSYLHQAPHSHSVAPPHPPQSSHQSPSALLHPLPPLAIGGIAPALMNGGLTTPPLAVAGQQGVGSAPPLGTSGENGDSSSIFVNGIGSGPNDEEDESMDGSAAASGAVASRPLLPSRSSSRTRIPSSRSRDASLTRRPSSNSTSTIPRSTNGGGGMVLPPLPSLPTSSAASSLPSSTPASTTGATTPIVAVGTGVGAGMNLVAREAVQAADLIPSLSTLPAPTLLASASATSSPSSSSSSTPSSGVPPFQLLVMGVPTVGAKSRVETQIKISLSLVRPRPQAQPSSSSPSPPPPLSTAQAESYLTPDGGLSPLAATDLERLGSWTHLRLPRFLALKAKGSGARNGSVAGVATGGSAMSASGGGAQGEQGGVKKGSKPEPSPSSVLSVSVAVISATDPSLEVFICPNCQQRELKRSLRKKDPKGKTFTAPIPPPDPNAPPRNEEEELRKVVVFNAPEFVEFGTGECVVPTRITCYCRHHKEKKGFRVAYTLHDHLGNLVATGQTPPIMITDDHKTSTSTKGQTANSAQPASGSSAAAAAASATAGSKRKAAAPSASKKSAVSAKAASPAASATSATSTSTTSGRPRRSTAGRSRRGQSASDDELEGSSKKSRAAPYEGRKRTPVNGGGSGSAGGTGTPASHRSPTFAMTPLVAVSVPKPPTPNSTMTTGGLGNLVDLVAAQPGVFAHQKQQHQQQGQAHQEVVSPSSAFATALGLGGMNGVGGGDAVMANGEDALPSGMVTPSSSVYLPLTRAGSIDPTGQAPFDFDFNSHRGSLSSPPLSPGSTAPSVAETFHSLFSGFPSPNPSVLDLAPAPPPSIASAGQTPAPQIPLQPQQPSHPGSFASFTIPSTESLPTSLTPDWSLLPQQLQRAEPPAPPPRITRIIPGEGPVHGGIEVTVLGENFVQDLVCVFGDSPAFPTHFWSSTTLVCVLPPSANPGPVVVGIKGVPLTVEQGTGLQLFTYKDDSDRSLLELALQVVGLKMTGKLENAAAIAMRIVGNSPGGGAAGGGASLGAGGAGGVTDTAALAATLNTAASSVYATPAASRASSRRSSLTGLESPSSPASPLPAVQETRNFQDIVIKFLSLLDLDPSLIPGAAPSLPSSLPPISQPNAQSHTLLHLATVLGFHRLVAFLLARGIALDAPDRNGFTALHFAALHGRVAIARLLLDAGARVGVRNLAGKTALEIAQERDDVDVEELLLARGAANVTPTAVLGRRQLVGALPSRGGSRAGIVDLSEEEEEEDAGSWSGSEREWPSDWTVSGSEGDDASASEWDDDEDEDDDTRSWASSGEEADESGADESPFPKPVSRPRSRQSMLSRNASTVSLHYLLEAEEAAKVEKLPSPRPSPRLRKVPLPVDDASPATGLNAATPFNHLASASSAWFQQKLKPTVQPSLNKLQPLAGGVADVWGKARANGFTLPPMHMPEITAFHAMPAALTRRMSKTSRRYARLAAQDATETEGAEEDAGSVSEHSTASGFTREWRFAASHWWQSKAPSSPPPQYTPTDALVSPLIEKESAVSTSPPSSPVASSSRTSSSTVVARSRMRRRTSASSYASEDTDSEAFHGEGKLIGISGDRMLLLFWLPVLLFMLIFAFRNWTQYAQPVLDTLADTILPRSIARLIT
ncbi:hypothetical protein JCM11251_006955 [Rhodosporidiobolus azoricus]